MIEKIMEIAIKMKVVFFLPKISEILPAKVKLIIPNISAIERIRKELTLSMDKTENERETNGTIKRKEPIANIDPRITVLATFTLLRLVLHFDSGIRNHKTNDKEESKPRERK